MLPPWVIAELERKRREREREREQQPVLEVDPPTPPRQTPRPEVPRSAIVIEF